MFRKVFDDWVNPKPLFAANFFHRAYSAYLSSCSAAMAGAVHDTHALLRVCLEQVGYGVYICDDEERFNCWMNRHTDEESKKAVMKEFTHGNIKKNIANSCPNLEKIYSELYEQTINFGGHPNVGGVSFNSKIEQIDENSLRISTIYLHEDGLELQSVLITSIQVGICALKLAGVVYPDRITATGVADQVHGIARRY